MSHSCAAYGCGAEAIGFVCVNIPAQGHPIDTHQPIQQALLRLRTCAQHGQGAAGDILDDDVRQGLRLACRLEHKAPPDFDRAFLSVRRIDVFPGDQ